MFRSPPNSSAKNRRKFRRRGESRRRSLRGERDRQGPALSAVRKGRQSVPSAPQLESYKPVQRQRACMRVGTRPWAPVDVRSDSLASASWSWSRAGAGREQQQLATCRSRRHAASAALTAHSARRGCLRALSSVADFRFSQRPCPGASASEGCVCPVARLPGVVHRHHFCRMITMRATGLRQS